MTRREFLLLAATFGAPLVPWRAALETLSSRAEGSEAPALLVSLVRQHASARVIGAAYLEATPFEADARTLVDAIAAGLEGGPGALRSFRSDLEGLRRLLARRVQRDFEEEATVCLRGWVVSRTEARLCGLAQLKLA